MEQWDLEWEQAPQHIALWTVYSCVNVEVFAVTAGLRIVGALWACRTRYDWHLQIDGWVTMSQTENDIDCGELCILEYTKSPRSINVFSRCSIGLGCCSFDSGWYGNIVSSTSLACIHLWVMSVEYHYYKIVVNGEGIEFRYTKERYKSRNRMLRYTDDSGVIWLIQALVNAMIASR